MAAVRDVSYSDFLGREEVKLDMNSIENILKDKRVLSLELVVLLVLNLLSNAYLLIQQRLSAWIQVKRISIN